MAIVTKGIFTKIDNMLMDPLAEAMDSATTHRYCALAAQLKELRALYIYGNIMSVP
ncbi:MULTISPECIES: hypothetical protein [unclassified Bartonella]|uniref:hypothetical protein n=1 Tax=unclassified Bartonella TaxID=2645622 RepID=UPI0035CFD215